MDRPLPEFSTTRARMKVNIVFGYILTIIVAPFWLMGGLMVLFSYPDDHKNIYPWNIVPLRLGVQGLLLPLLIVAVPIMGVTFPIWYCGWGLALEAFGEHRPFFFSHKLESH